MRGPTFANHGQIIQTIFAAVGAVCAPVGVYFLLKNNNALPRLWAVAYASGYLVAFVLGILVGKRLRVGSEAKQLPHDAAESTNPVKPHIEGELYRLASAPRTMSWEFLRDVMKAGGRGDDAAVDCDILVEMYLVNIARQTKYIRDLRLSVEIDGRRNTLQRMPDLRAMDMDNNKYEYALEGSSRDLYAAKETMKPLMPQVPLPLISEQPAEGWVRFFAKDINPDKIDSRTWKITAIDSMGNEYAISKVTPKPNEAEVTIRRLPG